MYCNVSFSQNILYHAVKECVAVLENYEMNHNGRTC